MVVFTCTHCGDSLQKPKVEKHYQTTCRTAKSLTCVDCLKDFRGEEYAAHTKCVTEEERYAAKGANFKPVVKKGEVKQESWTESIKRVVANVDSAKGGQKRVLNLMASSDNVPRKRNKFINFIKSATGGRIADGDIEAVWKLIEQHKSSENGSNLPNTTETNQVENKKKPKSKKGQEQVETAVVLEINQAKQKRKSKELEESNNDETGQPKPKKHKKKAATDESMYESTDVQESTAAAQTKPKKKSKDVVDQVVEATTEMPKKKRKERTSECNEIAPVDAKKRKSKDPTGTTTNGIDTEAQLQTAKPKKHKSEEPALEPEEKTVNGSAQQQLNEAPADVSRDDFSYEQQILKVLTSKNTLSIEKLQKKVLGAFSKKTGREISSKVIRKFNKKLKKMTDDVEIKENNVKLINKS